jgi:hypothetical protein
MDRSTVSAKVDVGVTIRHDHVSAQPLLRGTFAARKRQNPTAAPRFHPRFVPPTIVRLP